MPLLLACALAAVLADGARAQAARSEVAGAGEAAEAPAPFRDRADSLAWARARERAERAAGPRVVVSLRERRLWWIDGRDTLLATPVAVGKGGVLAYRRQRWVFDTPRGVRRVLAKAENPVWVPPLWHFVERAREKERPLVELRRGAEHALGDGSRVVVRGDRVGRVVPGAGFVPAEPGEEVVYDGILFVPPLGTVNRQVPGELGAFKLDLGDGYLIHGTRQRESIGTAATHGCIRVGDRALRRLYQDVPVGTPVHIY